MLAFLWTEIARSRRGCAVRLHLGPPRHPPVSAAAFPVSDAEARYILKSATLKSPYSHHNLPPVTALGEACARIW
jgi:hypothetical protein